MKTKLALFIISLFVVFSLTSFIDIWQINNTLDFQESAEYKRIMNQLAQEKCIKLSTNETSSEYLKTLYRCKSLADKYY